MEQAVRRDMAIAAGGLTPTAQPSKAAYGSGRGTDSARDQREILPLRLGRRVYGGSGERVYP